MEVLCASLQSIDEDTVHVISPRVEKLLKKEIKAGINTIAYYKGFQNKIEEIKLSFIQFLINQKRLGKKVIGYGAAAKGNTLINFCGIHGTDFISFVVDASPHKQHKFLPGSHIPVVGIERIYEYKPDYIVVFPWNLIQEISNNLSFIKTWGGKLVIFIPGTIQYW